MIEYCAFSGMMWISRILPYEKMGIAQIVGFRLQAFSLSGGALVTLTQFQKIIFRFLSYNCSNTSAFINWWTTI